MNESPPIARRLAAPSASRAPARARETRHGHRPARRPAPRLVDACAAAVGLGLGATIAVGLADESFRALGAPGGWATAGGRLAGLAGAYLMLVVVLLTGRVPVVERTLGQDRLTRWHRRLAPWTLGLIALHGALITLGYAQTGRLGLPAQYVALLRSYPGVLGATVGFVCLSVAGVTSAKIARRRMRYETWWAVHLYTYLGLALAFSHQIDTGAAFVGHPVVRTAWIALWLATAGTVCGYRILLPLWRTLAHGLQVVAVEPLAPGVVSVLCRGRGLHRMRLAGGQFFQWRIMQRGLWWQAHPYSVSALPDPPYLRFTVRDLGDHSGALARLAPGTRLAIEGPYGAFTADQRVGDRALLIGAGIGMSPLRALLQDMPAHVDVVMIARIGAADELPHADELRELIGARRGRLLELAGTRSRWPMDPHALAVHVPDLAERDVYICGPTGFTASVRESARALGVPDARIHHETFAF